MSSWLTAIGFFGGRADPILDGRHDPPESGVGPDDRRPLVPRKQILQLRELVRLLPGLGKTACPMSLWRMTTSPASAAKSRMRSQRRIQQAGRLAGDLRGDELLVDGELANPREGPPGNVVNTRRM